MRRVTKTESIPEIIESINSIDKESIEHTGKSRDVTNRIIEIMEAKKWMQRDLAENMGKSEAEISKLLSGIHNFTLRTIAKFEAVLEQDIIMIPKSNYVTDYPSISEKRPLTFVMGNSRCVDTKLQATP